jgi:hypothetical protein
VVTFRVDLAEPPETRATLVGLSAAAGPERETLAERLTVPEKPF